MARTTTSSESNWSARLWWTLAGVALLDWSFRVIADAPQFGWSAIIGLLAGGWGLCTVIVSWVPQLTTPLAQRRGSLFAWATALVTISCFAAWAAMSVHGSPAYGTDELAFDQYAGWLLRHGDNPYAHQMAGAFQMFRVSPAGWTFTLTGQRVLDLSYPALSFLLYVPFLVLGWSNQLGVGLNVIGWSLSTLLMFGLLPRSLRPVALVLGSVVIYMQLSVIGLTDMLFMPLLIVSAYRWDRFGQGWRSYAGPVAFGLAMAVKQTPWPVLPFILLALALDERRRTGLRAGAHRAGRYLLITLIAFVLPNLAFIIASPAAWARGTFTPIIKNLVPAGQGLIGLSLFLHVGGGSLTAYSLLLALALVLALVTYVGTYPLLRAATFALPAIAYFFALRSYTDYLVALIPPGLVAAVTADAPPLQSASRLIHSRRWTIAIATAAGACAIVAIYACASSSPLSVRITNVDVSGVNNIGNGIQVAVRNRSGSPATPAFTLETASGVSSFWDVLSGPRTLAAGHSASYLLGSPDPDSQFSVNSGITVLAFLDNPASVSVSNRYSPKLWHVGFDPESYDSPIRVGTSFTLRAQLLNAGDQPIARAGVPVTLRQAVHGHLHVASIDGARPGRRAVAYTNARGIASFTIVGTAATGIYPDTLSALLPSGAPYRYTAAVSDTTLLRFTTR